MFRRMCSQWDHANPYRYGMIIKTYHRKPNHKNSSPKLRCDIHCTDGVRWHDEREDRIIILAKGKADDNL